ncbi:MAG: transporter substrate-binding domain-containing protein [Alphaproteobacteria bacterium]
MLSRRFLLRGLVGFAALLTAPPAPAQPSTLTLFVSEIPGQSDRSAASPGLGIELVQQAATAAGLALIVQFVPWVRATVEASRSPTGLVLPLTRLAEREAGYTWIAPLYDLDLGFVALGRRIDSLAAADGEKLIGVWRGTSHETQLRQAGLINLAAVADDQTLLQLLLTDRVSAWFGAYPEILERWRRLPDDRKPAGRDLTFGTPIIRDTVWLAGGKTLDPALAQRLATTITAIQQTDAFAAMRRRYLGR